MTANTTTSNRYEFLQLIENKLLKALEVVVCLFAVVLSLPITIPWVVLIVGLGLWLLLRTIWLVSSRLKANTKLSGPIEPLFLGQLFLPIIVFAAAVALSGSTIYGANDILKSLTSLRSFIVYFWAVDVFSMRPSMRSPALASLLAAGAVAGICGTFEQLCDWHPMSYKFLQGTGFLSAPMAFAGQMQIFSLLSLTLLVSGAYKILPGIFKNKLFFALIAIANICGVIFAAERSAWLGAIAGTLLICAVAERKLLFKALVFICLLIFAGMKFIPMVHKRLMPLLDWQHDVGTRVRLDLWSKAWELFRQAPIFGVGVSHFPHMTIKEALVPGRSAYLDHAHNNYLQIFATMGSVGFIAYIYLLGAMITLCWRNASGVSPRLNNQEQLFERALSIGVLAALVSLMVAGLFEYNFGTGQVRLTQWFILAMLLPGPVRSVSAPESRLPEAA